MRHELAGQRGQAGRKGSSRPGGRRGPSKAQRPTSPAEGGRPRPTQRLGRRASHGSHMGTLPGALLTLADFGLNRNEGSSCHGASTVELVGPFPLERTIKHLRPTPATVHEEVSHA